MDHVVEWIISNTKLVDEILSLKITAAGSNRENARENIKHTAGAEKRYYVQSGLGRAYEEIREFLTEIAEMEKEGDRIRPMGIRTLTLLVHISTDEKDKYREMSKDETLSTKNKRHEYEGKSVAWADFAEIIKGIIEDLKNESES